MKKAYFVKVFAPTGIFITSWNDVVFKTFRKVINGGLGELHLQLARPFDNFGEGVDVRLNNEIQIWCADKENSELLIYDGYVSAYRCFVDEQSEGVEVICLGYGTTLSSLLYKNGTSITIAQNSVDPSAIVTNVIDRVRAEYSNVKINYSTNSIANTGTTISYTFVMKMASDVLDKVRELAPADWFWYIGADNIAKFQPVATTSRHTFVFKKDFKRLEIFKNMEAIRTNFLLWNGMQSTEASFLARMYSAGPTYIAQYGNRWEQKTDGRITTTGTADALGTTFININKEPDIKTTIEIIDSNEWTGGYDIESISPGDTCNIRNVAQQVASTFTENMLIVAVDYEPGRAILELESSQFAAQRKINQIRKELETQLYNDGPASYTAV